MLSCTIMYKINSLLKQNQTLYHTNDLALIWNIKKLNTLYTTIKRYVKKGILIPIHKGYYSTIPIDQNDPIKLGISYLHNYAYLSCESVLIKNGIIFQTSSYIILVSDRSAKFTIDSYNYFVRQLSNRYLFQTIGIENDNGIYCAVPERAIADLMYFNPNYHFDNQKAINWLKVRQIQKEIGYRHI